MCLYDTGAEIAM